MGDYTNNSNYWNAETSGSYYETDYNQFQNEQLEFNQQEYADQTYNEYPSQMYTPPPYAYQSPESADYDEPPLLEELEIYPDRIMEKVVAVLNPFRGHSLTDDCDYLTKEADLAGPIFFCLFLAFCLFLSGNKAHFSYIYGISMISCFLMYCLLTLMTANQSVFTFCTVASILGYCLIPVIGLGLLGVFFALNGILGIALASGIVSWCSYSASRLFTAVSGDKEQQPLIAYPCALVYGVYVLLVLF